MKRNRLLYAGLLVLASFASACAEDVGPCEGTLKGRDTVIVNNTVVYGGQAIMNKACTTGCHLSTATGAERKGVPAGLDFDLLPIDEEDAAGTKKNGSATIVKLKSAQIAGLRARQKNIVKHRDLIWQQVLDGLMPPGGMFEEVMGSIYSSAEASPCKPGKAYSKVDRTQTREVLRNWLACGAPLVETNGAKVTSGSTIEKSRVPGVAGYQYPACTKDPAASVTLESLFKSTFSECGGCHNGGSLAQPPEFLAVDSLAKSLRTKSVCGGKPFVTPGKPDKSYLLDLLKAPNPECMHGRMPAGGLNPLSDRAIAEVEAWIAAGAPTTVADVRESSDDTGDEPTDESDDESPDMSVEPDDDVATPDTMDDDEDAGALQDAGRDAGKDAGRADAGPDAGRDAGKDAGRDAGKDAGR